MLHEFELEVEDLSIIPLIENDIEQMRIWRNLDHIRKNFIFNGIIDVEGQKSWFHKHKILKNDFIFMIIENKYLNRKIGTVSIYNFSEDGRIAEFGRFFIGDNYAHGKGYGVLSAKLACNIAFNQMSVEKLILEVFEDNSVAYHIYQKVGFKKIGMRVCNGRNIVEMELKKTEFEENIL